MSEKENSINSGIKKGIVPMNGCGCVAFVLHYKLSLRVSSFSAIFMNPCPSFSKDIMQSQRLLNSIDEKRNNK